MELILSLFPGIDLLGRGFERAGFCVVRSPDLILGGDIRDFHAPPGKFDGVIGGSPCQDFSRARRSAPNGYGKEMIQEFRRVVLEAMPEWWLLENVPSVPDVSIDGYSRIRFDLNAAEFGSSQKRLRHFQFGHAKNFVPLIPRTNSKAGTERCCMASEGKRLGRRSWSEFTALQGLPDGFDLPAFTQAAKYRAVGNGVHVDLAFALAKAINNLHNSEDMQLCACGCGRQVTGKAITASPACRKRKERKTAA